MRRSSGSPNLMGTITDPGQAASHRCEMEFPAFLVIDFRRLRTRRHDAVVIQIDARAVLLRTWSSSDSTIGPVNGSAEVRFLAHCRPERKPMWGGFRAAWRRVIFVALPLVSCPSPLQNATEKSMSIRDLQANQRVLKTAHGEVLGSSYRWPGGQYCAIHTDKGIVGCGIYDCSIATHFGIAVAIARGTPEHPLFEPEDLMTAKIAEVSRSAAEMGITVGMTGEEALRHMLAE
jgi:uncharacterized protein YunC (DUF1805 family)